MIIYRCGLYHDNFISKKAITGLVILLKNLILALLVLFLFLGVTADVRATHSIPEQETADNGLTPNDLAPHDPIYIGNDTGFNATNGVSGGNGTEADPYIISGLEIDAQGGAYGIYVEFTNAHFKIINCTVYNATRCAISPFGCGIALNSVTNATIENCTVYGNKYNGIWVRNSQNIQVRGNTVYNNTQNGIGLTNSAVVAIEENNLMENGEAGVLLQNSETAIVRNNQMTGNDLQISGEEVNYWTNHVIENNTVNGKALLYLREQGNTTVNGDYGQIIIASGTNITVESVEISKACVGIQAGFSQGISIVGANISENKLFGIYLYKSSSVSIVRSTISANGKHGIFVDGSDGILISQCLISSNGENGVRFMESSNSQITENRFISNGLYGVYITYGSISNEIHHNDFIGNNGATATYDANHTQAYDSTASNSWCPNNYGNFWGDWSTPDTDADFVVDVPYPLDGAANVKDDFPLTSEHLEVWLYHIPVKYAEENSEIKVRAEIHALGQVQEVKLRYLPLGGSQYLEIDMSIVSGNQTNGEYEATIPAQNGTGYLRYYIIANLSGLSFHTPVYTCVVGEIGEVNLSLLLLLIVSIFTGICVSQRKK